VCGGEKVDFELFSKAAGCGMEDEVHQIHDHKGFYQSPCCENITEIIESNFEDLHTVVTIEMPVVNFEFELAKNLEFFTQKNDFEQFFGKDPPIIRLKTELSFLQVFRI